MSEEKKPFNNRNKCEFTGNLGADPKVSKSKTGDRTIVNATLYVTNEYMDPKTNEIKKGNTHFKMVAFGKAADDFLATNPKKGSPVEVSGRMQGNAWKDGNGQARYDLQLHVYKAAVIVPKPKAQPAEQKAA